ncbi:hypothetical protein [Flavobacterium sp.]|uniref:hypothetical protein n=1 Tax=Flavobacterium sp. TaxID=239 RepID=UPI003D6B01C3
MDFSEDLLRVLWHEVGHFCVDLLESEANPDFVVDDFWVMYNENAISKHKWGGGVRMMPSVKWNVLVEDLDKTSFSMLGSISGCVFETVFLNEFLQKNVRFEDCFNNKEGCAGQGDFMSFFMMGSELRKKYGRNPDFIKFSETELFDIYYKQLITNKAFLEQLNEIVVKRRDKILADYKDSDNKKEYSHHLIKDDLDILKNHVTEIMLKTSFKEMILDIKEVIRAKMEIESQV